MLISFKIAYSCCFSKGGNLDFLEFLLKKFYNIEDVGVPSVHFIEKYIFSHLIVEPYWKNPNYNDYFFANLIIRFLRWSDSNRIRTTLTISVEDIDFDTQACKLRLKGRNIEENDHVKMGAYHTIDLVKSTFRLPLFTFL